MCTEVVGDAFVTLYLPEWGCLESVGLCVLCGRLFLNMYPSVTRAAASCVCNSADWQAVCGRATEWADIVNVRFFLEVMIVVGGQAPKAIRSVECYDFEEGRWDQIAELPSRRCRAGKQPQPQTHLGSKQPFSAGLCLLMPSSPPPPRPPAPPFLHHVGGAYSEVRSYVLVSLSQFRNLRKPGEVRETNRKEIRVP